MTKWPFKHGTLAKYEYGFERARNSFSSKHMNIKKFTAHAQINGFTEALPKTGPAIAGLTRLHPTAIRYEISAHFMKMCITLFESCDQVIMCLKHLVYVYHCVPAAL